MHPQLLPSQRLAAILTLSALLLGGLLVVPPPARAAEVGLWTPVPPMARARTSHTATPLANGQVLVAGVSGGESDTAEVYDPATSTWRQTGSMIHGRQGPAAAALADGRVLVIGGRITVPCQSNGRTYACPVDTATAEWYDPATQMWSAAGEMLTARSYFQAARLNDGRVLVAGGLGSTPTDPPATADAEAYDPATDRWAAIAPLLAARGGHSVTTLQDGRVLVAGGLGGGTLPLEDLATVEIYDPATNRWSQAASMIAVRGGNRATLLRDGRVLVLGRDDHPSGQAVAEVYDPAADRWTATAPLSGPSVGYTLTLLADGRVLTTGGDAPGGYLPAAELYDPATNRWEPAAPMSMGRLYHTATLLPDGQVLVTGGGSSPSVTPSGWQTAERYDPNGATPPEPRACFFETGHCLQGRFLAYWQQHGGLARNGFPLSDERQEVLEDGNTYVVQYFERVRMEHHPENAPPYDVLLGHFGRRVLSAAYGDYVSYLGYQQATRPVPPAEGLRFFPETGHNISPFFLDYWEANGGLAQFGFPLTEERWDTLPNPAGACCKTQYFERARFEYHPENEGTPYAVLLGQFGRQILADNALLGGTFGRLYLTDAGVRDRLGAPRGPEQAVPGALQPFEHGLMIWRGDARRIFVLVGTDLAGELATSSTAYHTEVTWPDTWVEGEDPGGGPAPVPGRYLPQRGFGKLWREQEFRNLLGYATTPGETAFTMTLQEFAAGYLLAVEGPGGRATYAIYLQATGSHNAYRSGTYERVAAP